MATFALPDGLTARRARRGTRRRGVSGARTPGEADPSPANDPVSASEPDRRGERADTTRSCSEDEPNSTRGTHGASVPRVRHAEEDPETVRTVWGERPKPMRRYSTSDKTLQETVTSREPIGHGQPGHDHPRRDPVSLEGQGREPRRAVTRKGGGQETCGPHTST